MLRNNFFSLPTSRNLFFRYYEGMQSAEIPELWRGRKGVIATMHGKEVILGPLLEAVLGLKTIVPNDFDTDTFGTFTREIPRAGDQLEVARKKTLAAMELTGLDIGIASEGSFGVDPAMPLLTNNLELVLLIDRRHNLEIVGHHRTRAVSVKTKTVTTTAEALTTAEAWGFPDQGVIVRLHPRSNRQLHKEITSRAALESLVTRLLRRPFTKSVFLETDMRAHRCPARRESIAAAAEDLLKNCHSSCPQCQAPGFVPTSVKRGALCRICGSKTEVVAELVYTCQACQYRENRPSETPIANPADCAYCNP